MLLQRPAGRECTGQGASDDRSPRHGDFTLHGRPVDVLSDGHALLFVRARSCDLRHGRWLQRDPEGYIDGPNLYEAFGENAVANTDPEGTQIWVTERTVRTEYGGRQAWAVTYTLHRNGPDLGWLVWALGGTEETIVLGKEYYPIPPGRDWRVPDRHVRNLVETQRRALEERAILGDDIGRLAQAIGVSATAAVALPLAAVTAPVATTMTGTSAWGTIGAGAFTGGVSVGTGSGIGELLVGGTAGEVIQATGRGVLLGATGGAALSGFGVYLQGQYPVLWAALNRSYSVGWGTGQRLAATAPAQRFVPNPGGRLGDAATRNKTAEVLENLIARGFTEIQTEVRFRAGPLGSGADRYADVVARNPATGEVEIIQIGRAIRSDPRVPVMRERVALDDIILSPDIRNYAGCTIRFVDVNRGGVVQP